MSSKLTEKDLERIRVLAEDGVPISWIAEEFDVTEDAVRKAAKSMGYSSDREYMRTQAAIRNKPILAALHAEISPRSYRFRKVYPKREAVK